MAAWIPFGAAQAQTRSAQQVEAADARDYDLPAGPLGEVLGQFAGMAGVTLSFDAALTQGLRSAGLKGRYGVDEGFARLMDGQALQVVRDAQGVYLLQRPPQGAVMLPAVQVQATAASASTESTAAYVVSVSSTATKMELAPRETPQTVSVMTRQMLEDKNLTTMEQVLNQMPGVTTVGDSSMGSQISVRGFVMTSGIQVDGMNTTSANYGSTGSIGQHMDPAIADRVEVIKGATGIVSGLGSPTATVNVVRKRPTDTFQIIAEAGGGTWDRYNGMVDVGGPVIDSGKLKARLVVAERVGKSFIDRVGYDRSLIYGVADWDLGARTTASLAVENHRSKNDGIYGTSSIPAFYTDGTSFTPGRSYSTGQDWAEGDIRDSSYSPSIEHRINDNWTAKAAYRYSYATVDRTTFFPGIYVKPDTGQVVSPWSPTNATYSDRYTQTRSIDAYVSGHFSLLGREHDLVFGYNGGSNDFEIIGYNSATLDPYYVDTGAIDKPAISTTPASNMLSKVEQSGVFATLRLSIADALKLMLGGRVSDWEYSTHNRRSGATRGDTQDGIFTPYVGAVYDVNQTVSLYASHTGIFEPGLYYDVNGELLEPTEGTNNEVGIKLGFFDDALNASFALYETRQDNKPEYAGLGQLPSGESIYVSVDGIKTRGLELELAGQITRGWDLSAGYAHNKANGDDGVRRSTYIPANTFKLTSSYRFAGRLDALILGGSLRWQSQAYDDVVIYSGSADVPNIPVRQQQKAYTLLDAMARYQVTPAVSLALNLNNVLDKTYHRSLWGSTDYGEPRNAMLTLRAKW